MIKNIIIYNYKEMKIKLLDVNLVIIISLWLYYLYFEFWEYIKNNKDISELINN